MQKIRFPDALAAASLIAASLVAGCGGGNGGGGESSSGPPARRQIVVTDSPASPMAGGGEQTLYLVTLPAADLSATVAPIVPPLSLGRCVEPTADSVPAFSPDGRRLAVTADVAVGRFVVVTIRILNPDDGTVVGTITPASEQTPENGRAVPGFAWSPDSRHLVYSDRGALYVADVAARPITSRALTLAPAGAFSPTYSPDGARIAYFRSNPFRSQDFQIETVRATDGGDVTALSHSANPTRLRWGRGAHGGNVVYTAGYGAPGIARTYGDGSAPGGVGLTPNVNGASTVWDLSPDGQSVMVSQDRYPASSDTDLFVVSVADDGALPARPVATLPGAGTPVWSPDGRFVALEAAFDTQVLLIDAGTGRQTQVTGLPPTTGGAILWRP